MWKRIAIVAAGPLANLLLAVLLFAGTYMAGIPGQRALLADAAAGHAAAARAGFAPAISSSRVDGEPVASWQDLRWRLLKAQGHDSVALVGRASAKRAATRSTRTLSLAALQPADWEGNALAHARAAVRPRPAADRPGRCRASRRSARGSRPGDRIVAIDGAPVRSPADVAALTNAQARAAELVFRVERDGARARRAAHRRKRSSRAAARSASPGVRLRVDPAVAERLAVTVRYGPLEALAQGARKTWELSVFTLQDARPHRHRRSVAQEHQRTDHDGRLRRPVGAGRDRSCSSAISR